MVWLSTHPKKFPIYIVHNNISRIQKIIPEMTNLKKIKRNLRIKKPKLYG